MHDKMAVQLQSQILHEIERTGAKGVLIDISVLEMVDSFIGRMLSGMASMASGCFQFRGSSQSSAAAQAGETAS